MFSFTEIYLNSSDFMKAILICVVPATGLLAFVIAQYGSIKRAQLRHQKTKDKAAKKDNDKFRAAT